MKRQLYYKPKEKPGDDRAPYESKISKLKKII